MGSMGSNPRDEAISDRLAAVGSRSGMASAACARRPILVWEGPLATSRLVTGKW